MGYKAGLVSVSFRPHTPEEILSAMKNAGLSYIEWGSDVHAPADDIENLKYLVSLGEKYGISCCSYGSYFKVGKNSVEEILPYINAAKVLGTNIVRIWCGTKDSEQYTQEEKTILFDECKKLAKIAEQENVILCMECHNWTYTNRLAGALELMETVDSKNFQMYWQPNQWRSLEENMEYAQKIAKYTRVIHAFNWLEDKCFPLCEAVDTWKDYLTKFDSQYILLEFMPDHKLTSLGAEAKALQKIVEE